MKRSSDGFVASLHLTDFGTAFQIHDMAIASTLVGTPGCIAPEVFRHQDYDGFKADGILIFLNISWY